MALEANNLEVPVDDLSLDDSSSQSESEYSGSEMEPVLGIRLSLAKTLPEYDPNGQASVTVQESSPQLCASVVEDFRPVRSRKSKKKKPGSKKKKVPGKKKRQTQKNAKKRQARANFLIHAEVTTDVDQVLEKPDVDKDLLALQEKVKKAVKTPIKVITTGKKIEELLEDELSKGHTSAFYLVDVGTILRKFLVWSRTLPRVEPFYACKCNPDFVVVQSLITCGAGLDCASVGEIEEALMAGCAPQNIIFANPCKAPQAIEFAKQKGVAMMTFDNTSELEKVAKIFPEAQLVLRILGDDTHSLEPFGSKFGATVPDEAEALLKRAKELNLGVIGVSFHVGSGCQSHEAYVNTFKLARKVFDFGDSIGHQMKLLDIGGGWPGVNTESLSFDKLAAPLGPVLDELFPKPIRIIAEPGRYFATECTVLAANIIARRERVFGAGVRILERNTPVTTGTNEANLPGRSESPAPDEAPKKQVQYYLSDGVYGSFNNIFYDHAKPSPHVLTKKTPEEEGQKEVSTLFGPTCDSIDVICKNVDLPRLECGDWLYFINMGAYTSAAASSFNGFRPPSATYIIT